MAEPQARIQLGGSVWMTVDGQNLGGTGRMQLLALVGEQGSITHAAKAMGMSYKAAWDAIDTMNNLAGEPLVERVAGGKGGGGTRLTPRGAQLVHNFRLIEAEHQRFIAQLDGQATGLADDLLFIRRISMHTSARNHFAGTVTRVVHGAVNDEVEIAVRPGLCIVATVTHESAAGLGQGLVHRGAGRCRGRAPVGAQPPRRRGRAHHAGRGERRSRDRRGRRRVDRRDHHARQQRGARPDRGRYGDGDLQGVQRDRGRPGMMRRPRGGAQRRS